MAKETILQVTQSTELLPFLLEQLEGKGRNKVKGLLTHRQVKVGNQVVTRHDHPLQPGQTVTIHVSSREERESLQGIRLLFEDDYLLVIDKPPGMLSMATDEERNATAYHLLREYVRNTKPQARIFIVHRLDRETSGVMMYAKTEAVQQTLQNNWKEAVLERVYTVLVEGRVTPPEGTIRSWLKESKTKTMYVTKRGDGQLAVTHYKVMEQTDEYSLLECRLETGRKNQIRVHMQSQGHSVVGDKKYGSKRSPFGRLGLHARVLAFVHPVTQELLRFETPVPQAFRRVFGK